MHPMLGKIIGVILGFIFDGPRGAMLGFIIGHLHDTTRSKTVNPTRQQARTETNFYPHISNALEQSTYMVGIVVLSAKLAKTDGRVTREEITSFRRVFRIPDSQVNKIGKLFDQARQNAEGYEPYAQRMAQVFCFKPVVLDDVMAGLFMVAAADNANLAPRELSFLRRVGTLFGLTVGDFQRLALRAGVRLPESTTPPPRPVVRDQSYVALGLPETASDEDIKRTYRVLIRKFHPDKVAAAGGTPAAIKQANERTQAITAAYATICKVRRIK